MQIHLINLIGIYRKPLYWSLLLLSSTLFILLVILLPNIKFIVRYLGYSTVNLQDKVAFLFSSLGAFNTNFTILSQTTAILIAILFGVNLTLTVYYIRQRANILKLSGTSGISFVIGLIGVGCASCGSLILTQLLGVGAASFLTVLPYDGQELSFLAIAILAISSYLTYRKIIDPITCEIKKHED